MRCRTPSISPAAARSRKPTNASFSHEHRIEVIVAKNSGGAATYGKIAAARSLGLPVIMLARPARPQVPAAASVEEALVRLDHVLASEAARGV